MLGLLIMEGRYPRILAYPAANAAQQGTPKHLLQNCGRSGVQWAAQTAAPPSVHTPIPQSQSAPDRRTAGIGVQNNRFGFSLLR